MTVFIAIVSVMTLVVLGWLLLPLLRTPQSASVSTQQLNIAIYREQLEGLDRDLARGAINAQEHESARDELQLRMLDDAQDGVPAAQPTQTRSSARWGSGVVALIVVAGSAGMYHWLGNPAAMDPLSAQKANELQVVQMVEQLAQKLKDNPDNPRGWSMLARSYKVMGRLDDAAQAYSRAGTLLETDPDVMADYADLLAVRAGDDLRGKPMELVGKALAINPKHPMSLLLAAAQAYRDNNFTQAIQYWETLLTIVEPGSPDAEQLTTYVAEARSKTGMGDKAGVGAKAGPAKKTEPAGAPAAQVDNAQILQMVERLATRLKSNPDDLEGWAKLARSYKVLGRLEEGEAAYGKAAALVDKSPEMLTDFADLLATRANGNLEGRPLALVNKALKLEPRHPMALMLSGTAAYRRGDYKQAIGQWETLKTIVQPGSAEAQWVDGGIADAKARMAGAKK